MRKNICIITVFFIISAFMNVFASDMAEEISAAESMGLVTEAVKADYDKNITREEYTELICLLCDRLAAEEEATEAVTETEEARTAAFTDTENESVKKAYELGIINGVSDTLFAPERELTRQEAVTILVRMIFKLNPEYDPYLHAEYTFIDDWQIDYWAQNAVEFAYYCGIIKGTEEYVISPLKNITRREAVVIVKRTAENIDSYLEGGEGYTGWEWYVKPKYDGLVSNTKFHSGRAVVKKSGKYGYVDTEGDEVIPFKFDNAYGFSNGMARVIVGGKTGYIDRQGNMCVEAIYDDGGDFSENLVWVKKDGLYGFIDKSGNTVIPFEYDHAYPFTEGIASVKKDGFYGYIDHQNNTVIDFKFKWAAAFKEQRARVGEMGRYGYIDKTGELVIPMIYEKVFDFNEERAAVYYRDFGGIIDRDGNVILPFFVYSDVTGYFGGVCHAKVHGVENPDYSGPSYYFDHDGNMVGASVGNYLICEGLAATMTPSTVHGKVVPIYKNKKAEAVIPATTDYYSFTDDEKNCYQFMDFSEGIAAAVDRSGKLGFIKNPLLK